LELKKDEKEMKPVIIIAIAFVLLIPISVFAQESQICIDKVWMENTKGKIACVTPSTADKLVEQFQVQTDSCEKLKEHVVE